MKQVDTRGTLAPQAPHVHDAMIELLAPLSGIVVALDEVPDAAFAQRLAGDGASIDPLSDRVLAPCDAEVLQVHRAGHAVTLRASGLEIIIHVGLDTVMLKGEGFSPAVRAGDHVRAGELLLSFDADLVARRARSLLTQVVIANMDQVASIEVARGIVSAGRDVLLRVALAGARGAESAIDVGGELVTSDPIVVTTESGLHARPAAMLAATVRPFVSDVRLVRNGREANVRSVVSILALEVAEGDSITVSARGSDAREAVRTVVEALAAARHAGQGMSVPPLAATSASVMQPTGVLDNGTLHDDVPHDDVLRGVSASPGVATGTIFHLRHADVVLERVGADPTQERRALDAALSAAHVQLETLQASMAGEGDGGQTAIFAAHQALLEDTELLDRASDAIRSGASAAFAWQQAYLEQASRLAALKNTLIAGRATDLRDVGQRVLHLLVGIATVPLEIPAGSILIAEDITPSDTATLDRTRVRGFCTTMGSATSHAAIIARGLGLPAVAGIDPRVLRLEAGTRVVLDGDAGLLRTSPSAEDERDVEARRATDALRRSSELSTAMEPAVTTDGRRIEVAANVGDTGDAVRIVEVGGEGVGLLRSEFLFQQRRTAPTEDEQAQAYGEVVQAVGPDRLVVIRTLDVGGDKPLAYLPMAPESNPFLGERGVRLTLARPELFRTQIRAILRASKQGRVAIMFPMIATLAEWRAARAMVEEERAALGLPAIQIGIMVETAAAALLAEQFARDADFLSIGTNDLTQYTLAMDRTNARLAPMVDALHPSVLKLIELTVIGAHAHGRWVGICGALAGDLSAVPVLVGLGVDELSTDVPIVPAVKARVRGLSMEACRQTAREALAAGDGAEVRAIVERRHG